MDRKYQDKRNDSQSYRGERNREQSRRSGEYGSEEYRRRSEDGSEQYRRTGEYGNNQYRSSRNGGPYYGTGQNTGQRGGNMRRGTYENPDNNPDNSRKKGRKKKKRTIGDFISGLLMVVALCVFLYSGYTLYGYYKEYKKSSDEYDNLEIEFAVNGEGTQTEDFDALENETAAEVMTERETTTVVENGQQITVPLMNNPIDFEELQKVNKDIVGWLRIRALDISYPVVQGEDNDFYLHRTFEKEENFAGCIFMNCDNKADFTDHNTIIYGHNMKNGSMFGKLKNFNEEETFQKSEYFWIFTPELIYQYHIFSAMTVSKTGVVYQTFYTEDEFNSMINMAFEQSVVDNSDMVVENGDRIVTLSTCTGDDSTRFVVMGKLEQVYAVRGAEQNDTVADTEISIQ